MNNTRPFCQDLELYAMDIFTDRPCTKCNRKSEDPRCPNLHVPVGLNKLANEAYKIAIQRKQTGNGFKHLAGEVIEAQEAYDHYIANLESEKLEAEYADELADVIICALSISAQKSINIEAAIARKMERNKQRAKEGK